jgi:hypothetical protein
MKSGHTELWFCLPGPRTLRSRPIRSRTPIADAYVYDLDRRARLRSARAHDACDRSSAVQITVSSAVQARVLPVLPLPFIPVQYRWNFDHIATRLLGLAWKGSLRQPVSTGVLCRKASSSITRLFCGNCSQPLPGNGRCDTHQVCPLLKVNRPCHLAAVTSHFDPGCVKTHWLFDSRCMIPPRFAEGSDEALR